MLKMWILGPVLSLWKGSFVFFLQTLQTVDTDSATYCTDYFGIELSGLEDWRPAPQVVKSHSR